ncbi:hypothetical protein [Halogeometricum sp. CBA1124]|uniref:hypothetical protein n=1 Tax=Halogeometricum sp. CBA1124 TaxID=2668071 RepID=UPI00142AD4CC|nr:hypothetical protein [Halogeometricum sp. CBA1124]MUV56238.1 hypothetical protein [Halogeometricum sp. CBA1124]
MARRDVAGGVADALDVAESTAWTYKYRVNDKIDRARQTVTLKGTNEEGASVRLTDTETALEDTFFNTNVRGNDRGASRDHALLMVRAHLMYEHEEMTMQEIAETIEQTEDEVDRLLGEAAAIRNRAKRTSSRLKLIPTR